MRAIIILSLILVLGIGISFGQTDDVLVVTIIDEDGNVVELPSVPHVPPNVTEDSPPPPSNVNIIAIERNDND